jgi:Fuc2NAc and GlcNAc transferase
MLEYMSKLQIVNFEFVYYTVVIGCFCLFLFNIIGVYLYQKVAVKINIIANLNYRTLHESPLPKGGGMVFSILSVISLLLVWWQGKLSDEVFWVFGLGGFIATVIGFIDDIKNIRARTKLVVQLFLSAWVVYWFDSSELLQFEWMPNYIIDLFFLFLMVWMINAYNFMDGIDGIAASGAIFISLTLSLVLFLSDNFGETLYIFMFLAAAVSGFIIFNWPPASIFMGDAGSVFLGYTFGALFLFTVINGTLSIWTWLVVFGYFFADTTVTQIARVILVKKWWHAHRSHAYQNLARLTGSHLKVTGGVALYNVVWILPLTLWSALQPEMALVPLILAVLPGLVLAYKYGPIFSSS